MKLAILSDVHGNFDALLAVLKECKSLNVEKYIFLGDYVGYYYDSDKVIKAVRELNSLCLKGNHEVILHRWNSGQIYKQQIKEKYGSGHELAFEKLSEEDKKFLFELPESLELEIDGIYFSFNHANPWNSTDYIYPDTLVEKKLTARIDYAFFGHSHYQFIKRIKEGKFIYNVGSVGQNRFKGGIANWMLYDTTHDYLKCFSTNYDITKLVERVILRDGIESYNYKVLLRK